MQRYKLVIFDFDGTIASSLPSYIKIYNLVATKHNLQKIKKKDIPRLRGLSPKEVIAQLKVHFLQLPMLFFEGRNLMKKFENEILPIKGIKNVLKNLSKNNKLIVLTSNTKKFVENFFIQHKIDYFSEIWSELNIFGKDRALKKILKKHALKPQQVLYIADEVRDIIACKKVGIAVASVTWGFNSRKILKKESPNYIINSPEKLVSLLK
ncbi:hypothetical protein A3A93_00345 [Candidatus Roizmanbacteria bacterium RIFCSPLOWO2_01_FULL_38_12]|uniref:Carotenoid oxygenase n=1 Tax=Candidatus Roizmanbacteria bacterium RIFCSPLOWO2_01_FULL_38_12 TaxID=1802061 RepID=A0A1F7J0R1_9BACT|nr:MAG: hypothetical protein A3F59_05560 [Candidatus Roizmanbacteria bacterium RIFCSPHIGHO2_12_FULL_38_13]OGK49205.1 MAG: hypothetical protein A3A93_00345 [Candidatus Roizmanbacteria bacterium RIFCSPLOWO2_01_FULL_38_12]